MWAKVLLVLFVLLLVAAGLLGGLAAGRYLGATESRDVQVIRSITTEEQVVLASAGLTDVIEEQGDAFNVFGLFDLPGSERSMLVRYDVDAKFGIEGKDVSIRKTGDSAYLISIPEFSFLGYENPDLSVAKEENGLLSWTTPEIDQSEFFERILSEEAQATHIEGFRPVLEAQARTFYSSIVSSIDPDVTLEFEFAQ